MTNQYMPVSISFEAASECWGSKALISSTEHGVIIHLNDQIKLAALQRAGRKIDSQGIKHVALVGEHWDLETAWSFWCGFRNPKNLTTQKPVIIWPTLNDQQQQELAFRLKSIDWLRDIINSPADELSPEQLAKKAIDLIVSVAGEQVSYKITKGEALKEKGYMGIYTVGRGSNREPALLTLDFNPTGDKSAPILACLVGKGITFDTGGYSLKPSQSMDSMKADMGGAALVTASLALAILRGLKQRVKLILCCADNMVSGNAFKLGDIIYYRNGKSVEVMNTDAEGRLVLADGLIDAEAARPDYIIDCATLTGAAKMAVGGDYHALFSFDDQLSHQLLVAADQEHELFWRLPLAEFHRGQLPSSFADLNNVAGAAHSAGASTAAAFLSHFLTNYQHNWLHIDCSATYRKSAVEQWSAGATGIGARTLANLLLTLQ